MSSLKRILCARLPEPHRPCPLAEAESNHALKVLRLKDGDSVEALDGKGHSSIVKLRTRNGDPRLEFLEKSEQTSSIDSRVPVTLEIAILKGDAMEWVVEKAVELGVSTLVPVVTAHTVVQVTKKGPDAFRERWQKIADQALKQCGRLDRLEVKAPIELQSLWALKSGEAPRLWCDETERAHSTPLLNWLESNRSHAHSEIRLLIGPEGGWSTLERELFSRHLAPGGNLHPVSLGPLVLRAETAAIFSLSLIAADYREHKMGMKVS